MIILLTGEKGCGKSSVALNLSRRLAQAGIPTGGVICPGIFAQGRKIGILSHYPATGYEEQVGLESASWGKPVPEPTGMDAFSYGRWEFRQSALAKADASIIRDMEAALFVFVDEIGPLELDHGIGLCRTLTRLDADKNIDNCVFLVCTRQDLALPLKQRWPDSCLVELTGGSPESSELAEESILAATDSWRQPRNRLLRDQRRVMLNPETGRPSAPYRS